MDLMLFWLIGAVIVGVLGAQFGRSGFGWFLLACLISPVLAGLLCLAAGRVKKPGVTMLATGETATDATHMRCPDCAELVRRDARICRFCRAELRSEPKLIE